MKKLIVLSLLSNAVICLQAQDFSYDLKQSWAEKPVLHSVNKTFDSASAVAILDERTIEYVKVKESLVIYETDHAIIKIIDDKGIEMYNKIYIPLYSPSGVKDIKARAILKNGKVIDLPAGNIKEIEEDGRKYNLFAMD